MSKNVDLIAVGVLLVGFAFAARLHEFASFGIAHTRAIRVLRMTPIVVTPPHVVSPPRLPHFPGPRV
jgi:hypothetical protein